LASCETTTMPNMPALSVSSACGVHPMSHFLRDSSNAPDTARAGSCAWQGGHFECHIFNPTLEGRTLSTDMWNATLEGRALSLQRSATPQHHCMRTLCTRH
jgi:hypothetical protein